MREPVDPVHVTPRERMVPEGQAVRSGQYWNAFGEANNLEAIYATSTWKAWAWGAVFPVMGSKTIAASEEEYRRIFKIVFSAAGKSAFIEPFAVEGMRAWMGVPREIGRNDGRLMGGYIKCILDTQFIPNELLVFDADESRIKLSYADLTTRVPYLGLEEIAIGYETFWHNAVKTMVGSEWSCWFERNEDVLEIVVARKIDKRMI
jgi:hypothetical protein